MTVLQNNLKAGAASLRRNKNAADGAGMAGRRMRRAHYDIRSIWPRSRTWRYGWKLTI